jgi:hypothetical protein
LTLDFPFRSVNKSCALCCGTVILAGPTRTMSELYSRMEFELDRRLDEAERVGSQASTLFQVLQEFREKSSSN